MSTTQPSQTTADSDAAQTIAQLVDAVFSACILRYGQAYFLSRWEGLKLPAVKADWRRVLEGLERNPRAVRYALAHLPAKPPTASEFRQIASECPEPRPACLSWEPKHDPARIAAAQQQVARARAEQRMPADPLARARDLRRREGEGERLSLSQKEYWRKALAREIAAERSAQEQPR
ncbi:MAG: hypothetical protein WAQ08_16020 [Aquabacterium sp.]|uniref:hypothetical protein n=1 Tax=Aquabacterium sp. TaxID=1872578 RepID=UPI003BAE8EDF